MIQALFFVASLCLVNVLAISPFTLPLYFNDNMVLQRAPLNSTIWGFANTNSTVSTTIYGVDYSTEAVPIPGSTQFMWTLIFNAIQSSNQSITIVLTETRSDGVSTLTLKNVLFGDIWVCSGQSNMQLSLPKDLDGANEIATGSQFDQIRLFTVAINSRNKSPKYDLVSPVKHKWTQPTAAILGKGDWQYFSAVCWYYGKQLHQELNVPIGLIVSAWTGTNIEQWVDRDTITGCGRTTTSDSSDQTLWWTMISPFTRFPIKGLLWYQGESNADSSKSRSYDCLLKGMISLYRNSWYQNTSGSTDAQFPVGIVQIANPDNDVTTVGYYPVIRWLQTAGYGYAPNPQMQNVFLATAVDLSDDTTTDPIHPRNKKEVSARLVAGALNLVYGRSSIEYHPPRVSDICYRPQISAQLTLKSEFAISLVVNHQVGFEVCCNSNSSCSTTTADGWDAVTNFEVSGSQITLSIPSTCNVVNEVRYLWRQKPCNFKNCSLYSAASNLPLQPFLFKVQKECVVEEWAQCGGIGYTGITLCDPTYGLVCKYQNDWYSQCVKSPLPANTVAEWGQCGGLYYNGFTQCGTGLVCTYQNDWFWQCLKPASN